MVGLQFLQVYKAIKSQIVGKVMLMIIHTIQHILNRSIAINMKLRRANDGN